ncbi:MAG: flagellar basal body-associated FliL family protein [Desulfovibrionaceae bacterium]
MAAKEAPKDPKALPGAGPAPELPKKGSKAKKIVIILAIMLIMLAAAGGGLYWWFFLRVPAPADAVESAPASQSSDTQNPAKNSSAAEKTAPRIERQSDLPRSTGKVLPLPEFVVNLSDPSGKRYLKLGMEVEVNADVSKEIAAQSAKIRDAVIMLLAGKSFVDVSTPEGKVLLKAEVAARLNQILGAQRVVRVYFTDFVVQ